MEGTWSQQNYATAAVVPTIAVRCRSPSPSPPTQARLGEPATQGCHIRKRIWRERERCNTSAALLPLPQERAGVGVMPYDPL